MSDINGASIKYFWNSNFFANLISLLAFGMSFFVLYKTELNKGKLVVSSPRRIAIASAKQIKVQGNDSDKILLSFSIYNNGANLKTIKSSILTITNKDGKFIKLIADAQLDELKDIRLSEFSLDENKNYSLITATSIPPRSHHIANQLFFYLCDQGWHSKDKLKILGCEGKPNIFELESGFEYKAKLEISSFETKTQSTCFSFVVPQVAQSVVLDFSPISQETVCPQN